MTQLDRAIKYAKDLFAEMNTNHTEWYPENRDLAERLLTKQTMTKRSKLRNCISACVLQCTDDIGLKSIYHAKVFCLIQFYENRYPRFKKFIKAAMPAVIQDFEAFKDFALQIYNIRVERGDKCFI